MRQQDYLLNKFNGGNEARRGWVAVFYLARKGGIHVAVYKGRGLYSRVPMLILVLVMLVTIGIAPAKKANAALAPVTGLHMFSYGGHNAAYDARLLKIVPEYLVDNTAHGFWGEYTGNYSSSSLLQNVSGMKAAGMKVIGYTTSGYEGRFSWGGQPLSMFTLSMLQKQITNMARLDGVNGVYIDEVDAYPNATQKQYLKALSTLARNPGIIIWGNTGVDDFDPWFYGEGGFDLMQSTEHWKGSTSLSYVQANYGSRISVASYDHNTLDSALSLTRDAWSKGRFAIATLPAIIFK